MLLLVSDVQVGDLRSLVGLLIFSGAGTLGTLSLLSLIVIEAASKLVVDEGVV